MVGCHMPSFFVGSSGCSSVLTGDRAPQLLESIVSFSIVEELKFCYLCYRVYLSYFTSTSSAERCRQTARNALQALVLLHSRHAVLDRSCPTAGPASWLQGGRRGWRPPWRSLASWRSGGNPCWRPLRWGPCARRPKRGRLLTVTCRSQPL